MLCRRFFACDDGSEDGSRAHLSFCFGFRAFPFDRPRWSASGPGARSTACGKNSPKAPDTVPVPAAPVSKHYPILVIAHGNEPVWSLRLGMKGPERLDRANYPPSCWTRAKLRPMIPGKPGRTMRKTRPRRGCERETLSGSVFGRGGGDQVHLRVVVDHAQIGTLNGCGQSMPEQFPEFRKKNQL